MWLWSVQALKHGYTRRGLEVQLGGGGGSCCPAASAFPFTKNGFRVLGFQGSRVLGF